MTDNVVQAWTSGPRSEPHDSVPVTLVEGSTFCVSDSGAEIRTDRTEGLFVRDIRIVSHWQLTVDDLTPQPLTVESTSPFCATFVGRVAPHPGRADSTVLVLIRRYVGDGMRDDIELRNLSNTPVEIPVTLSVDTDFADLFEVKEGRAIAPPQTDARADDAGLLLTRVAAQRLFELRVRADDAVIDPTLRLLRWLITIPARGEWSTSIEFAAVFDGAAVPVSHPLGKPVEQAIPASRMQQWQTSGPIVSTADADLAAALSRSVTDLGSLRIFDPDHPDRSVVAAGAPWFMALFGRDSLLTSWMVLPLDEQLAIGTLQTLAAHQGTAEHAASEEQPGRILHEVRFGHAATAALGGRTAYYGTVDATPLFVMLLAEVRRWGRGRDAVTALLPHADRALEWIRRYGDADGDGFVEYHRGSEHGLVNQGWKDSFDGINFADGALAKSPIALAEVQGYSYAAYLARAELADEAADAPTARRMRAMAAALKTAFNEAFWLPEHEYFAVGLDRDKRPIDAVTSNIGHCLWTGIIDDDKAAAVADRLLAPEMFSGWGIRTLSSAMAAYNPMSYHNGSIWPHDNAICAAGLARYGFTEHAGRIAAAIIEVSAHFGHRLPELFCGFDRSDFAGPVRYPTSCSPQAWASAAPLLLLRAVLGFEPALPQSRVAISPSVPRRFLPLSVDGLRVGPSSVTLRLDDDQVHLHGLPDHIDIDVRR